MSVDVTVPDEAVSAARSAYMDGSVWLEDALRDALTAAAPLLVAAELERLADEQDVPGRYLPLTPVYLRARVRELRGDLP